MTTDDLVRYYGTQAEAARAIGLSQAAISRWAVEGEVPIARQCQYELLTSGTLRADMVRPLAYARIKQDELDGIRQRAKT